MKHILSTIIASFACWIICRAQASEKPRNNILSVEVGKAGLIYNLSFDHKLATKNFGFRFGTGSNLAKYLKAITVGGGGYYLVGKQVSFLELGIDLQYLIVDEVSNDQKRVSLIYPNYSIKTIHGSLNLGYRTYGEKTMFRVGFSPGLIKDGFVPGGYISYGVRF